MKMQQLGNQKFLVLFSILFLINATSGLRCWRCSSDATNSKFCGDTLDQSDLTEQQKRWNYVECNVKPPQNAEQIEKIENLIPKCRILLQLVNEVPTYTRSCYWEQENVPSNSCAIQKYNPSYVKTVACNTCVEDGCNDKLISATDAEHNDNDSSVNPNNAATLSILSRTVFAIFVLSIIIGY